MLRNPIQDIIGIGRFLAASVKKFNADGCSYRAAALTYTTLLSLVPLSIVGLKVFSHFPGYHHAVKRLQDFIFNNFIVSTGKTLRSHLTTFTLQAQHLSWVGLVIVILTSILLVFTIEKALNHIWKADKNRNTILAFFGYWLLITLGPILLAASLLVTNYVSALPWIHHATKTIGLSWIQASPIIFSLLGFTLLYKFVPNTKVRLGDAFFGSVVATGLFEAAKYLFTFYLTHVVNYQLIYGVFATIPIFLIWLYISWLVILYGSVMSYQFAQLFTAKSKQGKKA